MLRKLHFSIPAVLIILIILLPATGTFALAQDDGKTGSFTEHGSALGLAPSAPVPGGPGFLMVNPFQFVSAFADRSWSQDNGQLFNPGPEDNFYEAALTLPNRVTITQMVLYYYDNSSKDLLASLWRIDPSIAGSESWTEMATVGTLNALDQMQYGTDTSINTAVIDQQNYSYVVEVGIPAGDNTLRLAGVRIDYVYPVMMPAVMK